MTTTVVTGSNRGIGLELCRQASARGDNVYALCRAASKELEALSVHIIDGVDVGADQSIQQLSSRLKGVEIDILINNAGILSRQSLDNLDFDAIRHQFEVNSLGPLKVTRSLLSNLKPGAKVAIVTSRMGSIADNTSGGHYGYRMSKAALNIAGVSLAHDLGSRNIAVVLLHPGYVSTDMTGHSGSVQPDQSVRGLLARIDELTMATSGSFKHMNGETLPW
ncbi:MAG: SDR family oxidoreductase [Arenicellales bacterium]|nr:SDR family oxidoreductase [Arenicellales bacterium]